LQVRSSELAISANSYSNGTIKARLPGAIFKFPNVSAASLLTFSSVIPVAASHVPAAISPINLSIHLCYDAILSFSVALFVSLSEIVQRISSDASRVSILEETNWFTSS
jgi:hypothetical protein